MTTSHHTTIVRFAAALPLLFMAAILFCGVAAAQDANAAQAGTVVLPTAASSITLSTKYIAAAISVAIGSIAAAFAVAKIGVAALGAAAEKPELVTKSIVLVGLGEGIALFGFLISIFLLNS